MKREIKKSGRAISYVRFSREGQKWGDSERRQQKLALKVCEKFGLKLVDTFTDGGVSAYRGKNLTKQWAEMKKVLQPGDCVLIEDVSRLTRMGTRDMLKVIDEITDMDVVIILCVKEVELNKYNRADTDIIKPLVDEAEAAKNYSLELGRKIKESWDGALLDISHKKLVPIGNLPSWLKCDWKSMNREEGIKGYTVDETAAKTIRRIFQMYNSGGNSVSITKKFNGEGIPIITKRHDKTTRAKPYSWQPVRVREILRCKSVIGYPDFMMKENRQKDGTVKDYRKCMGYEDADCKIYPAIVSEETFRQANERLKMRKRLGIGKSGMVHLTTGLCWCGGCGGRVFPHGFGGNTRSGEKRERIPYLTCRDRWMFGVGSCLKYKKSNNFRESKVEAALCQMLLWSSTIIDDSLKTEPEPSREPQLRDTLMGVKKQIDKLTNFIVADSNPSPNLMVKLKEFEAQERNLVKELDDEKSRILGKSKVSEVLAEFKKEFSTEIKTIEYRAKLRNIIRDIVEKLVFDPVEKKFTIHIIGCRQPYTIELGEETWSVNGNQFPYAVGQ